MTTILPTLKEIRPQRQLNIQYYNANSSKTLFLLHGAGGRISHWREQITFFKPNYNIVAFDNLGHGHSAKPRSTSLENSLYSFQEIHLDQQAIFTRYRTQENTVIGHSYGGAFASYLALQNPNEIHKLILIAPLSFKHKVPTLFFRLPLTILENLRPLVVKPFIHLAYYPQTDRQLVMQEMAETKLNATHVIKELILGMRQLPEVNIKDLPQPTLVLYSWRDRIVPAKQILNFYQQIPQVEFKEITNAHHVIMLEQPRQVNQLIQDFLQK